MRTLATLAAASVLTLAGAALAQTTPPPAPQSQPQAQDQTTQRPARPRLTRADMDALTDARMAAIQAGLKLTPEQQRLWTPVEQALRVMATARATRFEEARQRLDQRRQGAQGQQGAQPTPPDLAQRLEQGSERATQAAQRLAALSTAVKPFWASLSDDQKRILPMLMRREGGQMRMGMGERFERQGREQHERRRG
jgi:hypothetical protein